MLSTESLESTGSVQGGDRGPQTQKPLQLDWESEIQSTLGRLQQSTYRESHRPDVPCRVFDTLPDRGLGPSACSSRGAFRIRLQLKISVSSTMTSSNIGGMTETKFKPVHIVLSVDGRLMRQRGAGYGSREGLGEESRGSRKITSRSA